MKTDWNHSIELTRVASALAVVLGTSLAVSPVQADVYTFTFGPGTTPIDIGDPNANDALFSMLDPIGGILQNVSYPYYGSTTWGYGLRTQITGSLTFDTSDHSGTFTIQPFDFLAGGPAVLHGAAFTDAGTDPINGHPLVIGNMLADWASNQGIPVSLVWDVDGLLTAITNGLQVGDVVAGGTVPASDGAGRGQVPLGPSAVATTAWNTTNTCTPPGCTGVNPSGALPLIADSIAGSPMYDGPFPGFNLSVDLRNLRVTSIVRDGIPEFFVSVQVPGGAVQECSATNGANVALNAVVSLEPPLELASVTWKLDGAIVASGESVEVFMPLGDHTVEAVAETTGGDIKSSGSSVTIQDTVAPVIQAAFIKKWNGQEITEIGGIGRKRATVSIDVTDVCDPSPVSSATAGLPVVDGDYLVAVTTLQQPDTQVVVRTHSDVVELSVTAEDASGNMSNKKATLSVTP